MFYLENKMELTLIIYAVHVFSNSIGCDGKNNEDIKNGIYCRVMLYSRKTVCICKTDWGSSADVEALVCMTFRNQQKFTAIERFSNIRSRVHAHVDTVLSLTQEIV